MKISRFLVFRGYDLRVIALLLLAALVLGVLNNLRQPSEQRVSWSGGAPDAETTADADAQEDGEEVEGVDEEEEEDRP